MRHVNKQPTHIQKHLNGRRFLKAHAHWLECERIGQKFVPFCKQFGKKRAGLDEEMNEDDDSTLPGTNFNFFATLHSTLTSLAYTEKNNDSLFYTFVKII